MDAEQLNVQMLGEFSLEWGGACLSDGENRSRKVWLLLAYLIECRGRAVPAEELTELLWEDEQSRSGNPLNALKAVLHRARTALDRLGPEMGHTLVLCQKEGYVWNTDLPLRVDADEFTRLCRTGEQAASADLQLTAWVLALELYQGHYLEKLSGSSWAAGRTAELHGRYLDVLRTTLPLLAKAGRWTELARLGQTALRLEPESEDLCRWTMEALLQLEDPRGAAAAYEALRETRYSRLGALPPEDLRGLYREALQRLEPQALPVEVIFAQLREPDGPSGALVCDYDLFQAVYHSMARLLRRSGTCAHLAVLSLTGAAGKPLSKRSLDRAAVNLTELLRTQLRRGDAAARCTTSQFVLLLPQADYGNSQMVCARVRRAFTRAYPHSPVQLHVSIQSLEPN